MRSVLWAQFSKEGCKPGKEAALTFINSIGSLVKRTTIALLGDDLGGSEGGHCGEEISWLWLWYCTGVTRRAVVVLKSRGERMGLLNSVGPLASIDLDLASMDVRQSMARACRIECVLTE